MGALDDLYRQQSAHNWYQAEQAAIQAEAEEGGISFRQAEQERAQAAVAYRNGDYSGGPRIERAPGVAACVARAAHPDASQGNALRRGASRAGPRDRPLTGQGEGEPEGGPASDRALDADLPAVGLDDGLADV